MDPIIVPPAVAVAYCLALLVMAVVAVAAVAAAYYRSGRAEPRHLHIAAPDEASDDAERLATQAVMPLSLRLNRAGDMAVGETAYTWQANVWVDADHRVWVFRDADVYRTRTRDFPVKLCRLAEGYEMEVLGDGVQWEVGDYDSLEDESVPIAAVRTVTAAA